MMLTCYRNTNLMPSNSSDIVYQLGRQVQLPYDLWMLFKVSYDNSQNSKHSQSHLHTPSVFKSNS